MQRNIRSWDFDVFSLKQITPFPLVVVTICALEEYSLIKSLEFDANKLNSYLIAISEAYHDLPYHNSLHAADVTQTVLYMLTTSNIKSSFNFNNIATASIIIAAAVHDVGHPGYNGKFLITTNSPLALEYNDKSPLENMHISLAFKLLLRPENNFISASSLSIYREFRRLVIELVLLTDNDMHFNLLNRLDRYITTSKSPVGFGTQDTLASSPSSNGIVNLSSAVTDDRQLLILQVTLHSADVSNTAKPWSLYQNWLSGIMEEFYRQGDKEREVRIPISYAFDRNSPVTQSKFQIVSVHLSIYL